MSRSTLALLALGLVSTGCTIGPQDEGNGSPAPFNPTATLEGIDTDADGDGDGIVDLPASTAGFIEVVFARYTAVEAPSGRRIHLLAEAGVPDSKLRRTREVLAQHLTAVAGTGEGADKDDVANAMAAGGATVAIFQNQATADPKDYDNAKFLEDFGRRVVTLLATHIVVEGSPEYDSLLPDEDRTFGTTAALVYRRGLKTARAAFADDLETLTQSAIAAGTFVPLPSTPSRDLEEEHLALALAVHSGIWGHDPRGDGKAGVELEYGFATRSAQAAGDPATLAWIEDFFPTDHTFLAQIDETFAGTFEGMFRSSTPYTHRSQYLRTIQLMGSNSAELFGAPSGCTLIGNDGNNNIKGRAGDDLLIGNLGFDTAVFSGPLANYSITFNGPEVIVEDLLGGHDGTDTLQGFQRLQFTDQGVNL